MVRGSSMSVTASPDFSGSGIDRSTGSWLDNDMTRTERPTVTKNRAHRMDGEWSRHKISDGEFVSEHRNGFTGWTIRKSCRMTGSDWHVFSPAGEFIGRWGTLTAAKYFAHDDSIFAR